MTPASVTFAPETLAAENTDCFLSVTISCTQPEILRLHYRVENRQVLPLYLLNRLWQDITRNAANQQVFQVLSDLANVQVQPDKVLVSKAVVDVPYLKLVEVLHIPCLTQVAPGTAYEETVELRLPLLPYNVYQALPAQGPVVLRALHVALGYVLGVPEVENDLRTVATPNGTAFCTSPFPASYQSLIGVGPFGATLPVATRLDEPPPRPASTGEWTPWG